MATRHFLDLAEVAEVVLLHKVTQAPRGVGMDDDAGAILADLGAAVLVHAGDDAAVVDPVAAGAHAPFQHFGLF